MNRIKELREDLNLRQVDIANETGIDQRTLSNYETGKTSPDSYAIVKLAEFYGVSCDYLLGISDMRQIGKSGALEEIQIIRKHLDNLEKYLK